MTSTITRTIPPQRLITVMNPVVRATLESSLHRALDGALVVLHVRGRRTGHVYDIPVGYVALDGHLVVITQHAWRANLRAGGRLDVTRGGRREPMTVTLDENPVSVAATLHLVLLRLGRKATQRFTGLRFDPDNAPDVDELEQAAREYDLATLSLTPLGAP